MFLLLKNSAEFLSAFTSRSYAKRKNKAPDLPYSARRKEIEIIVFVLDVIDHKQYDKKFGYRGI